MTFLFSLLLVLKIAIIPIIVLSCWVGYRNKSALEGLIVGVGMTITAAMFSAVNLMLFIW